MLFNSVVFLLFAALFFALWPYMRRRGSLGWAFLTAASFVFYGWWDWRFLFLIAASGLLDFFSALGMVRWERFRKAFLLLSIVGNIGSLVAFKYSRFIAANVDALLVHLGAEPIVAGSIPDFMLILPVGISFYTFQSMSYTIDVYRRQLDPTRNIFHFFGYLSMFPQLVAGPIVRAATLLPQMTECPLVTEEDRWEGLRLVAHGYFKKMVIADGLAPVVSTAFAGHHDSDGTLFWWLAVTMFAVQIYCDFSGYSDIARGLGRWMGFRFPVNFNHPYTARGFRDFWERWHMSLSTWFRDYVYIPLGGSRRGVVRGYGNLCGTLLISGLWHGASWLFIIWGGVHALFMSAERAIELPRLLKRVPLASTLLTPLTLLGVWIGWVFFRASSFAQAWHILSRMFVYEPGPIWMLRDATVLVAILGLREGFVWFFPHFEAWRGHPLRLWVDPACVALLVVAAVFLRGPGSAFIYFQF